MMGKFTELWGGTEIKPTEQKIPKLYVPRDKGENQKSFTCSSSEEPWTLHEIMMVFISSMTIFHSKCIFHLQKNPL